MNTQQPSQPDRTWKRISIRALLVCTALIACLLARWSSQRRLEQEIVHIIEKHEGAIYIDFREDLWGRIRRWCTPFHDSFAKGECSLKSLLPICHPLSEKNFSTALLDEGE